MEAFQIAADEDAMEIWPDPAWCTGMADEGRSQILVGHVLADYQAGLE